MPSTADRQDLAASNPQARFDELELALLGMAVVRLERRGRTDPIEKIRLAIRSQ
jgi:hypothetical protein